MGQWNNEPLEGKLLLLVEWGRLAVWKPLREARRRPKHEFS